MVLFQSLMGSSTSANHLRASIPRHIRQELRFQSLMGSSTSANYVLGAQTFRVKQFQSLMGSSTSANLLSQYCAPVSTWFQSLMGSSTSANEARRVYLGCSFGLMYPQAA
jgi:hypothetical protein